MRRGSPFLLPDHGQRAPLIPAQGLILIQTAHCQIHHQHLATCCHRTVTPLRYTTPTTTGSTLENASAPSSYLQLPQGRWLHQSSLPPTGPSRETPLSPANSFTVRTPPHRVLAASHTYASVFFTYRQPQRMIIHQARFLADLSRNAVPPYLLLAVCAVAAPLSKQPKLKTSPSRYAGERFAQEAIALMYKDRNLNCEPNLATAQALCLLQLHDRMGKSLWNGPYYGESLHSKEV